MLERFSSAKTSQRSSNSAAIPRGKRFWRPRRQVVKGQIAKIAMPATTAPAKILNHR
jgi:hypothetical protein